MAGFWGALAGVGARGLAAGVDQQTIETRRLVAEAAKRRAEDRQRRLDDEKMMMDRAALTAKGITPASTHVSLEDAPPETAPGSFADILARAGAANGLPTTPARSPLDPAAPVLPKMPTVKVEETPATFDPMGGTAGALEAAREAARSEAQRVALESRESEGEKNRTSREQAATNRERLRAERRNEIKKSPVTGNGRLAHITKLARQYMQPTWNGGMGLNPGQARTQATTDVDEMIASDPTPNAPAPAARRPNAFLPAPGASADPGGDVDLRTGPGFPARSSSASMTDPIDIAVQHLRDGTGTLAQLDASNKSATFKAEVKRRYGAGRK
jgi:hypothetical protein